MKHISIPLMMSVGIALFPGSSMGGPGEPAPEDCAAIAVGAGVAACASTGQPALIAACGLMGALAGYDSCNKPEEIPPNDTRRPYLCPDPDGPGYEDYPLSLPGCQRRVVTLKFDTEKHELEQANKSRLDDEVTSLERCRHIKIIGYADGLGSTKFNKHLSKQRAIAVAKYLDGKLQPGRGHHPRLEVMSGGELRPDNEAEPTNRRVDVVCR